MVPQSRLTRLLYYSRQSLELGPLEQELRAIVDASLVNNGKAGLTGLLLAHQGWFIQALEGPGEELQATYDRIVRDRRHTKAAVISRGAVEERLFGAWAMCARQLGVSRDAAILDVLDQREFAPAALTADMALRLLSTVANVRESRERAA